MKLLSLDELNANTLEGIMCVAQAELMSTWGVHSLQPASMGC